MRRLLMMTTLLALASLQAKQYFTHGTFTGYLLACSHFVPGGCKEDALPDWIRKEGTVGDTIKEMDAFYEDGANISRPMIDAWIYAKMKVTGYTKSQLDAYLKATAR